MKREKIKKFLVWGILAMWCFATFVSANSDLAVWNTEMPSFDSSSMADMEAKQREAMEQLEVAQKGAAAGLLIWSIFWIVAYVAMWFGLFKIATYYKEEYPWLWFIPVANIYLRIKVSKTHMWWIAPYIVTIALPLTIIWIILVPIAAIVAFVAQCIISNNLSKRVNRGIWTTLCLIFLPYIMLPIIGLKLAKEWDGNKEASDGKVEWANS